MNIDITPLVSGRIEAFLLVFVRLSAFLMAAPVFSNRTIPIRIRVLSGLVFAFTFLPLVPPLAAADTLTPLGLAIMIANEALLGVILGFVASALLFAVQIGGELLGLQIGFGVGSIIDPGTESQSVVTTEFLYLLCLLVFLTLNGHHLLFRAFAATLERAPLGEFRLTAPMIDMLARELSTIFAAAFRVGAPVMAFLFVTSVALGIISRTMPQMNVFVLGFPIKILGSLVVLLISLPGLRIAFQEFTVRMGENLTSFVGLL
ncbi:MAG: flagellar biosynthetic protein FliR [bacterium]